LLSCPICETSLGAPWLSSPDRLHGTSGEFGVAVCAGCGAGVTVPRVGDEQLGAFYPQTYGPHDERLPALARLASRVIRAFQGWNALRTAPLRSLRGRKPGRGLDVGCGRGDLAATLIARGWIMDGVEPSRAACEAARQRGVDARCGTLATIAIEPGAYDLVVFRHSLEHTNDPVRDLRVAAAALAPGGRVLISVPNFASRQARRFGSYWFHLDLPRHRVHFTPAALERALRAAGFEAVSLSTSSSAMGLPASVQYRRFGRCLFPDGLPLRVAVGLCALALPAVMAYDRGDGDTLHAVASRRPG
jgi:SAM-dependent methyltransferase